MRVIPGTPNEMIRQIEAALTVLEQKVLDLEVKLAPKDEIPPSPAPEPEDE